MDWKPSLYECGHCTASAAFNIIRSIFSIKGAIILSVIIAIAGAVKGFITHINVAGKSVGKFFSGLGLIGDAIGGIIKKIFTLGELIGTALGGFVSDFLNGPGGDFLEWIGDVI